ncbi:RNA-binding protein [uncultured Oscillibacter sp.]|uniref:YlmH family RNA-binding protein n=1 Tax=uncultured Oscillibacter sp. TaxID=876091 RepID=UPI0025FCD3CB|nr:YlmH/Sll1252 family protein [uncultured Oscillibacter sp.]
MDKTKLLDRAARTGEERLTLARVLDRREQARGRNIPAATDFLSPQERASAETMLRLAGAGETEYTALGGYDGAERTVLLFLPDWLDAEDAAGQSPLRFLRAEYRAEYGLTHRDILGSLMGMGVTREKLGDLLVGPERCDLIVLESVAQFLLQSWDQAGRAHLRVREIGAEELTVPQEDGQEIRDTVMSLRLDAVAASGFRLSRGRAAALIQSGRVQVNWMECVKPDRLLEEGDTVSARGCGKFRLTAVGGLSKKGRTAITIKRYG